VEKQILQAQKEYWNRQFANEPTAYNSSSHWLDILTSQTSIHFSGSVLEIGCGRGYDTRYLLAAGCRVTSLDLSWNALQQLANNFHSVQLVNAALPDPLPFRSESFGFVIAGLSLHYFLWHDTCMIIREIGRVLRPNGRLIFRVNSIEDVAHGAGRGDEIEPNLYYYEGRYKRFFTERMCRDLFDSSWRVEALIPWLEMRSQESKPTWMGVIQRDSHVVT
jgi:SAM-dependent methyltransferase